MWDLYRLDPDKRLVKVGFYPTFAMVFKVMRSRPGHYRFTIFVPTDDNISDISVDAGQENWRPITLPRFPRAAC